MCAASISEGHLPFHVPLGEVVQITLKMQTLVLMVSRVFSFIFVVFSIVLKGNKLGVYFLFWIELGSVVLYNPDLLLTRSLLPYRSDISLIDMRGKNLR